MNTLTQFIEFQQLNNSNEADFTREFDKKEATTYEIIENEKLQDVNLDGINISGSLFSLTTFVNASFESCVFFGSKWENCTFVNCNFNNCEFKFSEIVHCNFEGVVFEDCTWDFTPVRKCTLEGCQLDTKTNYFISKKENQIKECLHSEWINREDLEVGEETQTIVLAFSTETEETSDWDEETITSGLEFSPMEGLGFRWVQQIVKKLAA